jgi:ACT domain-containing protein
VIAVDNSNQTNLANVEQVCNCIYLHRDAYYKYKKRSVQRKAAESQVMTLVKEEREIQPRTGTRKLHKALGGTFQECGLKVGRDRLFDILRMNDMLVKRKKLTFKTTNSYHHFYKYNNLIKDMNVTAPNQVWVSDITYIRTVKGFCYLALITDLYSRKIVGYDISDSLELTGLSKSPPKGS